MPSSCSGRPICARSLEPNVLTTALQAASCVEAPDIDGDVGDPCWAEATTTNAFTPPGEATPAAKQVEARVAFDDTYLYLGFVCHEPEPLALQLRHRQDHPDVWTRPLVGWWRSNLAARITPVTRQLCPSGPRARCTTGIDGYGRLVPRRAKSAARDDVRSHCNCPPAAWQKPDCLCAPRQFTTGELLVEALSVRESARLQVLGHAIPVRAEALTAMPEDRWPLGSIWTCPDVTGLDAIGLSIYVDGPRNLTPHRRRS